MDWLKDILPEIITAIISLLVGGCVGFRVGVSKKQKMVQRAGDNAQQIQVGGDFTKV